MRRFASIFFAAFALGAGAYLATTQIAASSPARSRTVTLRFGDVAVFGKVQCIATAEARVKHLLCQRRPRRTARYEAAVFPDAIEVFRVGNPDPIFTAP